MERDFFFPSIIRTTCRWSPCNIKSLSACSHREAASQAFLECPEIKRVLASSQSKKQENNRDPVTSYQHLISSSQRASRSSPQTAYTPDNTFQTVAKVIWCWQMSFVMTVTATIKLTTSIITIIFAPKVPIHKEHVFFFYKYKEIHRMILYTTYNKYCVSYILLFERMYVGVFVCKPIFFLSLLFFIGLWIFFFSRRYSQWVSPSFHGVGVGWGGVGGWLRVFPTQSWAPHVSTSSCSSFSSPSPWCRRLRGFFCSLSSFRSLALRAPISGSPNCQ